MNATDWFYITIRLAGVALCILVCKTVIRIITINNIAFTVKLFIPCTPTNMVDVMELKYVMIENLSKLVGRNRIYHIDFTRCMGIDKYTLYFKCSIPKIVDVNRLEFDIYRLIKTYSDKIQLISITRKLEC